MEAKCPFCNLPAERIWFESKHSRAFLDGFPIAEGHTLVIPKIHVVSLFELPEQEAAELWSVVARVRGLLRKKYAIDAFNLGVNDGAAAGQTVAHAHVHIIPRRQGDIADPRGGIRWIIPEKAKYW